MREFKYAFTFFTNEQEVLYYTVYIENIIKNIFRLGLVWKRRQRGLNDHSILEDVDHVIVQLVALDHGYLDLLHHHNHRPVPFYKFLIA